MIVINTGEYAGFNPLYSFRRYAPPLNYLVEINAHNNRVAIVDTLFSISVGSFCSLWLGGLIVLSKLDFVLLVIAQTGWRAMISVIVSVRRPEPDIAEAQSCFRFSVFTLRWILLNISVALLFLSGCMLDWSGSVEAILSLAALSHLGFAFWPLAQWSRELLVSGYKTTGYKTTGPKTKRPIR